MKLPPPDTYHVGVHFYPDEHMAPRRATVRVFVLGEERFPPGFGPGSPMTVILDRNDFWYVGRVVVPAVIDNSTVEAQPQMTRLADFIKQSFVITPRRIPKSYIHFFGQFFDDGI